MSTQCSALVIGCGIAGPVAAMALQRAGIGATVFEAYEQSAGLSHGAWLTVATNGLAALRAVGADQPVLEAGFATGTLEFASGTGKHLASVPVGLPLPDGTVTHSLKRADLYHGIAAEAARRGIQVVHGKRLTAAEATPAGVLATFADGSTATGDLLIGADGVHSAVREIIDPAAPAPHYTGLGNIGGFAHAITVPGTPGAYNMVFGKRCFFGYCLRADQEVWWFANPPHRGEIPREELAATSPGQWRARMLDLARADKSPMARIIAASEPFRGSNQYDLPAVPVWHRGPMIIIGDAAHAVSPSSGQGVSMAAEDAVTLAKCLRDLPGTPAAFATYERLRRDRVQKVVAYGARGASRKQAGPAGRVIRDLILPVVMKRAARPEQMSSLSWLFNHHIDWDTPVRPGAA